MSRKPKVLIVENSIDVTGAFNSIIKIVSQLSANYDFLFVIPTGSKIGDFLKDRDLPYYSLPFLEISKNLKTLFLYLPFLIINGIRIKRIVKKEGVKIVHLNDYYNLAVFVSLILGAKFKLISHVRFVPSRFPSILANFWQWCNLVWADYLICVSQAVLTCFPVDNKILLIYDPLPEIEKYPLKTIENKNGDLCKLLYIGNYIPGKGQEYAIKAFKESLKSNQNIRLEFIGGDMGKIKNKEYKQSLVDYAKEMQISEYVTFKGFASDVEKEIKGADVCLNFSDSESFSLTCLDSLFYGTPLIATDCGGPSELFENGKSGILVPTRDIESMSEGIKLLSSNVKLQQQFSVEGRKYVREKFSKINTSDKIKLLYKNLLE